MPFEEQLPEWHAQGVEPPASKKNTGWNAGEKPPADYWNWQMNRTYMVLKELREKVAEAQDLLNHTAATTGVHGATSTATPNTIVQRDSAGRFKAAAPAASDDVARKAEVDAHATRTDNPHGTTAEQVGAPSLTTAIPDGVSLNTVVTSGFYRLSESHPDAPPATGYGQMIVSRGGDTVLQIVTGFNYSHFYMRHGNPPEAGGEGVWQPWRKLWHDGNLLYETGNFTPFVFGSTIAGTIPYSYQTSGRYMKIQNRIFVEGTVRADGPAIVQPTGDLYIGGLPYVIRGEASNLRSPAFTIAALIRLNLPDNGYMIVLEGVQGQSVIRVRAVVDSNEMANVSADDQSFTNAWHIRFSGWYETN
jgi:hypothetical protein